jgi:hypothetical protein
MELNLPYLGNAAQKYQKAFERYSDEDPYYRLELEGENGPGVQQKLIGIRLGRWLIFLNTFMTSLFVFLYKVVQHLILIFMRLLRYYFC